MPARTAPTTDGEGGGSSNRRGEADCHGRRPAARGQRSEGPAYSSRCWRSLPGGQLLVDLDGDGTPTGYLVLEDVYNGGIWLSANWNGDVAPDALPVSGVGGGGVDWATFEEWTAAFPDARVQAVGFSLGSGAYGVGTVHDITVAGLTIDFVDFSETVVTNRDGVVVPGQQK